MHSKALNIGFVVYPGFTGLDLVGPHEVLVRANTRCYLIGKTTAPIRSDRGLQIIPDVSFDTCPALDVLVVPGGPGQTPGMEDNELISFLAQRSAQAQWVAGVCTGVLLLAQAGILKGKSATTHWLAMAELRCLDAHPVEERIVRDGRIITGAGVSAGIDMALTLVAIVFGEEEAQRIQLAMEYDPQPPYDVGTPVKAPSHIVEKLRKTSRFNRN
ncbi:DJ-1/PfpI family protein [Hymenobacter sp. BT664]|uniref:DJ-1/PfpI family protein n=1 Tax=Hymenobacter montanus TaxID=2771359 RepID=A0A927BHF5_9BACT|nr:DJ-1/PfpI family protein [Hymenobacter montanus]